MEDTHSKFELLLIKELEEELTSEERSELDEFLNDTQNRILYEEQRKLWLSAHDLRKMKSINTKKALRKVEGQLFGRLPMRKLHQLERIAAILFIPLFIATIWTVYSSLKIRNAHQQLVYNTVEIPSGTKSKLTLSDGTIVWLNAGSSLTYPVTFGNIQREVELHGEAFFQVTKNEKKPFIVSTENLDIKVLGTQFNCDAYDDSKTVETALLEGAVELSGKGGKNRFTLNPGELAVFCKGSKTISKHETDLDKYVAWKSGKLMFRDDPMEKVIEKLEHWYGVKFQVEDEELLNYIYSATFSTESLDQVLKMLSVSAPINFEFVKKDDSTNQESTIQIIKLTKS